MSAHRAPRPPRTGLRITAVAFAAAVAGFLSFSFAVLIALPISVWALTGGPRG